MVLDPEHDGRATADAGGAAAPVGAPARDARDSAGEPATGRTFSPRMLIGGGLALSAVIHLALVSAVMLSGPRALGNAPVNTMTVDLVSPEEMARAPSPEPAAPPTPQPADAAQPPKASSAPEAPHPSPPAPDTARASPPQPASTDANEIGAAGARIMEQLHLPLVASAGPFDAPPTETKADLPPHVIAEFKAHLKRCWTPPAGVPATQKLKAVIRIQLTADGRLMTAPTLLSASASMHGPALVQSAMRALTQCQPYDGLPAEKYAEWKVLDLNFSSNDVSAAAPANSGRTAPQG
jgi:hypothetical protein